MSIAIVVTIFIMMLFSITFLYKLFYLYLLTGLWQFGTALSYAFFVCFKAWLAFNVAAVLVLVVYAFWSALEDKRRNQDKNIVKFV